MDKTLANLGLARRSGNLVVGTDVVVEGLRNNKVQLIFLASDSAKNTVKKITDKAKTYNVSVISTYTCESLSLAIGKTNCHVIGIIDRGFAKLLKE